MWQGSDELTPWLRSANFWDSGRDSRLAGGVDGFGPRYIAEFQILFVQDGRGVATVGESTFDLEPGDLVYYGPNVRHAVRVSGAEPLRLVGLVFLYRRSDRALLPADGSHTSDTPFPFRGGVPTCPLTPPPAVHVRTPATNAARRLCESLVLSHLAEADGRAMEKSGLLLMLFEAWQEALSRRDTGVSLPMQQRRAIERAEHRLRQEPAQPVDLESLAAEAGVSGAHLARLFKKQTGLSVRAYATHHRMLRARRLLAEGRLSVKQVARELGFDDPFYFSRLFTRHFGVAPSGFRGGGQAI